MLDAASKKDPPEAYANVNGAFWTTNWYGNLYKLEDWDYDNHRSFRTWTIETTTASQGDYITTNAVGKRKDGTPMETDEAEVYLMKQKCSVKTFTYELFTTDYTPQDNYYQPSGSPYDGFLEDVYVTARADCLEQEKAKVLEQMNDDTLYFGTGYEISQMTYQVGSFKMESIFPPTQWPDLAHDTSDEAGGNEYKGRLYWKYCDILEDGSRGPERAEQIFPDFLSYTYDAKSHSVCQNNQAITYGPRISDGVTRTFRVKPITKQQIVPIMLSKGISIWTGYYRTNTVPAGTKVEVVQHEKIYEGQ